MLASQPNSSKVEVTVVSSPSFLGIEKTRDEKVISIRKAAGGLKSRIREGFSTWTSDSESETDRCDRLSTNADVT